MIHLFLLLVCILSVEIFIRLNFLLLLESIFRVMIKVTHVISKNSISDHWKEKIVPVYALKIMKYSLKILFILFLIFSLFLIADLFFKKFLAYTLTWIGIGESIVFAFGYIYLRKVFIK